MKKYIVRTNRAGVFYGEIAERNGTEVKMRNVRKVFYWSGAAAIEQLAIEGTKRPNDCKITMEVNDMEVFDMIQIIPCTEEAMKSLDGVRVWKL